jgi:hypothetical protein
MKAGADIVPLWPRWMDSVGTMLRMKALVRARCTQCGTLLRIELEDVVARHGPGYSLVDRLDRCRLADLRGRVDDAAARPQAARELRQAAAAAYGARLTGMTRLSTPTCGQSYV